MKNFSKIMLVAFLMGLAIYQTGELWFEDFSSHSFFSFNSAGSLLNTKDVGYVTDRLIVNFGDGKVICKQSDIYSIKGKKDFDEAITTAISQGEFLGSKLLDWNTILNSRSVFYQYQCKFKGSDIGDIFKATVKIDTLNKMTDYDTIIILPTSNGGDMQVIFYNSVNDTNSVFRLQSQEVISRCYDSATAFGREEQRLNYVSTMLSGFTIFKHNLFIPTWQDTDMKYNQLEMLNPLAETSVAEKNADVFFDNPVGKSASKSEGIESFSDDNTVVKYYPNGVFEYSNYKVTLDTDNTFTNNYISALNVLKKDTYLANEFYLKDYTTDASGNYVFYFDYKIENLDIEPSEELCNSLNMKSFIEVTASKGRVSKYKKCAYIYRRSNSIATAQVDYIGAIDKLYARLYGVGTPQQVDTVELAYIAGDTSVELNWIIGIDQQKYILETR